MSRKTDKQKKTKKAPTGPKKTTGVARPTLKTSATSAQDGDSGQATPGFKAGKDI